MNYRVTLQYENRVQFTPREPDPDHPGRSRQVEFDAESPLEAARNCYLRYRDDNAKRPMIGDVPIAFAMVFVGDDDDEQHASDADAITSFMARYFKIAGAEIVAA